MLFFQGLATEKDGRSSAMSEAEGLDEEDDEGDDDEEGGAETEEQSGNESEINEHEEDVSRFDIDCDDITSRSEYSVSHTCFFCRRRRTMKKRSGRRRKKRTLTI